MYEIRAPILHLHAWFSIIRHKGYNYHKANDLIMGKGNWYLLALSFSLDNQANIDSHVESADPDK